MVEATRELARRRAEAPLSADRLFDLVLLATGDKQRAEAAHREFRHAELRSGQTPTS